MTTDETKAVETGPDAPRLSRGLRLVLILSLGLNLAVAGTVVALAIKGPPKPRGDMVRDLGFGAFNEALDEKDRDALREGFRKKMPDLGKARSVMRDDLDAVLAVLRAEPFDPAALDAVLVAQRDRVLERLQLGQTLLRERFVAMTPAQRAEFADRLEKSLTRHDKRR